MSFMRFQFRGGLCLFAPEFDMKGCIGGAMGFMLGHQPGGPGIS